MTLNEITDRLLSRYTTRYTRDALYYRVNRARLALRASPHTAPEVEPIPDSFPALYSPSAARRITRRLSARLGAPDRAILRRSKLPIASELLAELDAREINSNRIANRPQIGRKSAKF